MDVSRQPLPGHAGPAPVLRLLPEQAHRKRVLAFVVVGAHCRVDIEHLRRRQRLLVDAQGWLLDARLAAGNERDLVRFFGRAERMAGPAVADQDAESRPTAGGERARNAVFLCNSWRQRLRALQRPARQPRFDACARERGDQLAKRPHRRRSLGRDLFGPVGHYAKATRFDARARGFAQLETTDGGQRVDQ